MLFERVGLLISAGAQPHKKKTTITKQKPLSIDVNNEEEIVAISWEFENCR